MSNDNIRKCFRLESVDGEEKAVCTLCDHVIRNHIHCMRMHLAMHERQRAAPPGSPTDVDSDSDNNETPMDTPPPLYRSSTESDLERLRTTDPYKVVEGTMKYLAVCPDPQLFDAVVRRAPDCVIKGICNAARSLQERDVQLTEAQKSLFRAHRPVFTELTSPTNSIERKRQVVESQRGGFLPLLIGTALGALGSWLFGGSSSNQQQ